MGEALRVDLRVCGSIQEVNGGFISWIGHPLKKKKKTNCVECLLCARHVIDISGSKQFILCSQPTYQWQVSATCDVMKYILCLPSLLRAGGGHMAEIFKER